MLRVISEKIARHKSPQVNASFDNNQIAVSSHGVRNANPPTTRSKPWVVELVYIIIELQQIYSTKNKFTLTIISFLDNLVHIHPLSGQNSLIQEDSKVINNQSFCSISINKTFIMIK